MSDIVDEQLKHFKEQAERYMAYMSRAENEMVRCETCHAIIEPIEARDGTWDGLCMCEAKHRFEVKDFG